ncbi:RNA polymerase sigma factor [Lacipirellula parvula]|uniref:RNA polymerase sigma factor RpoE n=1 Tax=Lacipirellula parvula TaxID=2650471 RepID=A0A5K7XIT6_9BACT|nr:RNA polymerase sigma factor [Lacipirellula parvula]BBO36022.1 RNA polymerase sigma factor RpoE [Lacipirellula parvula]
MPNPFSESVGDDREDIKLVGQAQAGDREALERLILRHQAWIYNIAVRMVFQPQDAEEVTQEVLVKAVTRLSTFQGESKFRTWLYRIASNHVLNMRRRGAEAGNYTFPAYAAAINGTPDAELPDPKSVPVDVPMLVEETKLACTAGMLLCLDRKQRLIFTLGEIIGVSDTVGSDILEMTAANFRQCLARARRDLYQFMNNQCSLVNASNPCRCPKKTKGFIDGGHVDPNRLLFATGHFQRIKEVAFETAREIDDLADRSYAAIYREHPFLEPTDQAEWLRRILNQPEVRTALHLN